MEYKRSGSDILVRLDKGDKIKECLTELAKAEQIQTGFVSGIGAVDQVELSYFLPEEQKYQTKKFEGSFEVLSLKGTLSIFDKNPTSTSTSSWARRIIQPLAVTWKKPGSISPWNSTSRSWSTSVSNEKPTLT